MKNRICFVKDSLLLKKVFFCLIFMFCVSLVFAQKITVKERNEKIAGGSNNALTVVISGASEKMIEKAWEDVMKGYGAKVSSKGEVFADNATIASLSPNTVDVYAKTESEGENYKFIVAFDLGGAYLSSSLHSSKYKDAEKIVYDFAVDVTKKAIEEQLREAEKEQSKLEKKLDNLVGDNEKLHKDIEKYKNSITQAENDIETNLKDQEDTKATLESQKKAVEAIQEKLKNVN